MTFEFVLDSLNNFSWRNVRVQSIWTQLTLILFQKIVKSNATKHYDSLNRSLKD